MRKRFDICVIGRLVDHGPGGIAEIANQGGDVCLFRKKPESGGRELEAGLCADLRNGFEPNEEFEPCYASAICVRGGVSDVLPEVKEFMKEVFVEFP